MPRLFSFRQGPGSRTAAAPRQHTGKLGRAGRLPDAAKLALRVASLAALTTGGVALGRGVVGLANSRSQLVEVAGVSTTQTEQADAHAAQATDVSPPASEQAGPPVFSSSLRSWAAPPAVGASVASDRTDPQPRPVAAPAVPDSAAGTYTVSPGDTLSQIADRYAVDLTTLATANHLSDANLLLPGARLLIPLAGGVKSANEAPAAAPAQPTAASDKPLTNDVRTPSTTNNSTTPDGAVRSFYALVEQGQFDLAAGLWSQHMREAYPPAENITGRFARSHTVSVTRADVTQLDAANGRAAVAVRLAEVIDSQPSRTLHYAGDWHLVRGPAGWLLDQPALQQVN